MPLVIQAPFYLAVDRGYFQDEALDVEFVPAKTTGEAALLLSTGKVDFAGVGPDPALFNAMERGIDLKMLASAAVFTARSHASGVVVRQDHLDAGRFRELHDLRGLKIAVSSIQSQFYVEQILSQAGLSATDVEFTTLAPPDMVAALKTGAIDAAWQVEPLVTALEAQHAATLVATGFDAFPGGIPWLLVSGSTATGNKVEIETAVTRAVLRGIRDFYHAFNAHDGPSEPVFKSLAAHSSITDMAVLQKVGMHTVNPNGALETERLDAYQDYYVKTGNQQVRIDLNRFIDHGPLDAALSQLGKV
ncbi:MAG: hypothetical protein NVSMB2_08950 [Chloroflexota bacterium]